MRQTALNFTVVVPIAFGTSGTFSHVGDICLSSVLASLNLPAAIEDLSGQTIPKSVLDKSAAVNEKGGLNAIDVLMQDLPELLQRNREILDEVR